MKQTEKLTRLLTMMKARSDDDAKGQSVRYVRYIVTTLGVEPAENKECVVRYSGFVTDGFEIYYPPDTNFDASGTWEGDVAIADDDTKLALMLCYFGHEELCAQLPVWRKYGAGDNNHVLSEAVDA